MKTAHALLSKHAEHNLQRFNASGKSLGVPRQRRRFGSQSAHVS